MLLWQKYNGKSIMANENEPFKTGNLPLPWLKTGKLHLPWLKTGKLHLPWV